MKTSKYFIAMTVAALALSACSNSDEPEVVDITKPIELSVTPAVVTTRSLISEGATSFEQDDAIGVYLGAPGTSASDEAPTALTSGRYKNVEYTYGGSSWTGDKIYWQSGSYKHTIYAYYPFSGTGGTAVAADKIAVSIAADQTANGGKAYKDADYMWKQAVVAPTNTPLTISLDHKMSLIKVTMKVGDGFKDLPEVAALTPAIHGTIYKAGTWDLTDGGITATTEGGDASFASIKPYINDKSSEGTASLTYYAIVVPGSTFSSNAKFISLTATDGTSYVYNLKLEGDGSLVTATGTYYHFTLTANKSGISLSSFNMAAWTPGTKDDNGKADMVIN